MQPWIIAAVFFGLFLLVLPRLLRRTTAGARKGGGGGFAMGLWMMFAMVFDPAQKAAVEEVERQKETEGAEEGESGGPPA
ncbi:MAG: hypothetical protein ABIT16_11220 [Croceibacterium sp.]